MAGKLSECKSVDFVDGGVTEGCLNAAPFRGQWSWLSRSRLRESVRSVLTNFKSRLGERQYAVPQKGYTFSCKNSDHSCICSL